jgi:glycosyltransferase involved in cell wall biosynthesis
MEAMAAGRPIVATDVEGNEVLDQGRLGVLVPSDDALARPTASALLDGARAAALGRSHRACRRPQGARHGGGARSLL